MSNYNYGCRSHDILDILDQTRFLVEVEVPLIIAKNHYFSFFCEGNEIRPVCNCLKHPRSIYELGLRRANYRELFAV